MKSMITSTLALAAVMLTFALPADVADMMHKQQLECTACHTTGVGQPVPTSQCRTSHQAKQFESGISSKMVRPIHMCPFTMMRRRLIVRFAIVNTKQV